MQVQHKAAQKGVHTNREKYSFLQPIKTQNIFQSLARSSTMRKQRLGLTSTPYKTSNHSLLHGMIGIGLRCLVVAVVSVKVAFSLSKFWTF